MNAVRFGIRTRTRTLAGRLADLRFRPAVRRLDMTVPDAGFAVCASHALEGTPVARIVVRLSKGTP